MAAAASKVMVVILALTAEVGSEVTLAAPPPTVMAEEGRETGLSASPGGVPHGTPSWSELSGSGGDAAKPEAEHLPVGHEVKEVETPSPGEAVTVVEPSEPLQELAVVRSSVGPSSGSGATTDLVWPCPGDPRKVRFILQDEEEVQL